MSYCCSKTETERITVGFDWTSLLEGTGAVISTSVWACDDSTITLGSGSFDANGLVTTVWVSGGSAPGVYKLKNTVTLSNTGVEVSTIELHVLGD